MPNRFRRNEQSIFINIKFGVVVEIGFFNTFWFTTNIKENSRHFFQVIRKVF